MERPIESQLSTAVALLVLVLSACDNTIVAPDQAQGVAPDTDAMLLMDVRERLLPAVADSSLRDYLGELIFTAADRPRRGRFLTAAQALEGVLEMEELPVDAADLDAIRLALDYLLSPSRKESDR